MTLVKGKVESKVWTNVFLPLIQQKPDLAPKYPSLWREIENEKGGRITVFCISQNDIRFPQMSSPTCHAFQVTWEL